MKQVTAFFRLVRWPNLVFIIITQSLFYYCFCKAQTPARGSTNVLFALLVFSSVTIAAGGYIINDYFDMQIDAVNRPQEMIIDRFIKRRSAILWHWILSAAGMLCSFYVSYRTGIWLIAAANFLCIMSLWIYSVALKRKLLAGNIAVAALTAWVILVVYFFSGAGLVHFNNDPNIAERRLFKFTLLYAGFAFMMTIIREVIKDIEDADGDRQYRCRTMPIVWGVPAAKVFTGVWMVVSIGALLALMVYSMLSSNFLTAIYDLLFVVVPLVVVLRKLYAASIPADYHRLSNLMKLVMLFGILSMLLIKFAV